MTNEYGFEIPLVSEEECKLQERIEELEKENAELKEQVSILDNCDRLGDVITDAYKEQLAQAKKIIKGLLSCRRNYPQENAEKIKQAEEFIKE